MSAPSIPAARDLWTILRWPLAIFLATGGGLAAALLGEGPWHWLSWLLLAVPLAIIAIAVLAPIRRR